MACSPEAGMVVLRSDGQGERKEGLKKDDLEKQHKAGKLQNTDRKSH